MILNAFSPLLWLASSYRKCLLLSGKFMNRNNDFAYSPYLRQCSLDWPCWYTWFGRVRFGFWWVWSVETTSRERRERPAFASHELDRQFLEPQGSISNALTRLKHPILGGMSTGPEVFLGPCMGFGPAPVTHIKKSQSCTLVYMGHQTSN